LKSVHLSLNIQIVQMYNDINIFITMLFRMYHVMITIYMRYILINIIIFFENLFRKNETPVKTYLFIGNIQ
jgi:hypothetical protein